MTLSALLVALQHTPFATAIRENAVLFPWIESLHVLAVVIVVGTISIVDLRLLGLPAHKKSARHLIDETLPLTWIAFVCAAITGFLLFSSAAVKYAADWPFRLKMAMLLLAGINMAFFHGLSFRTIHLWEDVVQPPLGAKIAGGASLALWVTIIVLGRWIGFTTT